MPPGPTPPRPTPLGLATLRGLLWLLLQSAGGRIVSLVGQLALAWLLDPAEFGLIGLVYTLTTVAGTLTSFGLDGVLLQRHRTIRLWIDTAFWINLALGLAGFLVVAAAAPVFAAIYGAPELTRLALIFALGMPLGALSTVPDLLMRSALNFRFPALYATAETALTQLATIVLAWQGFGALSFVLPMPVFTVAKALVYWGWAPSGGASIWPRLRIRRAQALYLLRSGLYVFGGRLANQIVAQGDYAVLGLLAARSEVGFYYFAFRLASQPVWVLAGNLINVLFPALAQLRDDPARQLGSALRVARLLSYVIMPLCFLQAAAAAPALHVFFGDRWTGAIPLVQLLSIGLPFDAVPWVSGLMLATRREFRRSFLYSLASLPAFFACVGAGGWLGRAEGASAVGVAAAVAAYYIGFGPIYTYATFGRHGARLSDIVALYTRPPLLSGVAMLAAWALSCLPWLAGTEFARCVVIGLAGPLLYVALLSWWEPDTAMELRDKLGVTRLIQGVARIMRAIARSYRDNRYTKLPDP